MNLRGNAMNAAARKKTSRVIIVKNEAEFQRFTEMKLKKGGYVLLETAPKFCIRSRSQKKTSLDL